jgi:hypothetical protein
MFSHQYTGLLWCNAEWLLSHHSPLLWFQIEEEVPPGDYLSPSGKYAEAVFIFTNSSNYRWSFSVWHICDLFGCHSPSSRLLLQLVFSKNSCLKRER